MVDHAIWTHWGAYITLRDNEARRALWIPFCIAFLAVLALFLLSISTPEGKRLFTALLLLLEEFGASEVLWVLRLYLLVS